MNIPFSPANVPSADAVPSVPVPISPQFDFSDWQATRPTQPLPGSEVDAEFLRTDDSLNNVMARLALIQRDDGALANQIVGIDQMDPAVLDAVGDDADAAEAAADNAQASAAAAAASEAAAAASAAASAASAAQADAAADSIQGAIDVLPPPPLIPNTALVVNPVGDAYTFKDVILKVGGVFDTLGIRLKGADAANPTDLVTLQQAQAMAGGGGSGNVPPPVAADANKVLTALGAGAFGWRAIVAAMLSDVTAFMQGMLTGVVDKPSARAYIDAASITQAVPVPANPADDKKGLRANAGAFTWSLFAEVPAPVAGDVNKALTATGAGTYAWLAIPAPPAAPVQATEAAAGIAQIATQAETDAGLIDTDIITPLKLITHIATKLFAAARAVTGIWTFTDPVIVTQALAVVAASVNWNCALGHQGQLALSGNATMQVPTNALDGGYYHLEVINAGTFTLTWNAYFHFADGIPPTMTANGRDEFIFHKRGAAFYEIGRNQNVI